MSFSLHWDVLVRNHSISFQNCSSSCSSSMVLITVLKLDFSCPKCKKKLLRSISKLEGIDKIELDADNSTVTVTGNADPYEVIIRARKTAKHVQVLTVGPPPPPPEQVEENSDGGQEKSKEPENTKPEDKSSTPLHHIHVLHPYPHIHLHSHLPCHVCDQMMYHPFVGHPNEPNAPCSIL